MASCISQATVAPAVARTVRPSRKSNAVRGAKVAARESRAARVSGRRTFTPPAALGFSRDLYLSLDEGVAPAAAPGTTEGIAENVFAGVVAEKYLKKQGMTLKEYEDPTWCKSVDTADKVAAAVCEWALERGATNWCHWFQPMAASFRHGQSAQVQNSLLTFNAGEKPSFKFTGKQLLQSETDGSSYPNGGMRATHTAAAYLTVDPMSPIFLRGDAFFVPALFVSFDGKALDEKTPLHRSVQAMSRAGKRLFAAMGLETAGLVNNIGLEQEMFLIPREAYFKRLDLQMTGRTVMGKDAPRGQEGSDHYMGPVNTAGPVLNAMAEIQEECYKIGIPLITRHREVAPNQYEFAPQFGNVIGQIDNNLMVMQICEEVCAKHGLVCLMQEKPFANINGSGKHNNWSLSTKEGAQLFNPTNLAKNTGNTEIFPVIMSCMVAAIDKYGDLMRMAIATPGNDFRLGGMEAPPAVISTYLGEDMTKYLNEFIAGDVKPYVPGSSTIDLGVDYLPKLTAPAEDRNRTSPFPYGGARFEFRAVGSSQNVSLVNTVLNTMIAEEWNLLCDKVDAGAKPIEVAQATLKEHMKAVFNGDGYSAEWLPEAEKRGLFVIPTQPDAIRRFTVQKNVDLFQKNGVFSPEECAARENVLLTAYTGVVEMEALCMIDMMNQHVIPSMKAAGFATAELDAGVSKLKKGIKAIHDSDDDSKAADLARVLRLETMIAVRATCDEAEAVCPANLWTIATYKELLFNDPTMGEMLYTA